MRALTAFLGMAVPTLILVACSGDQPATTAPSTTPNFLQASKSYTFSLSCTADAGTSTVAQVTVLSATLPPGHLASLFCGNSSAPIPAIKGFDYHIDVYNASSALVNQCGNTQPIHNTRPITCGIDPSATLTITPS